MSKSQVDGQSTITLLLGKLTTGIPYLIESFGNNILLYLLELISVHVGRIRTTSYCSSSQPILIVVSENGPFTCYIEMPENKYNNGTLNLEPNDLIYNTEVNYKKLKYKLKFKGNSKLEYPILALNSEIEELKAVMTVTKKYMLFLEKAVVSNEC